MTKKARQREASESKSRIENCLHEMYLVFNRITDDMNILAYIGFSTVRMNNRKVSLQYLIW